LLLQLSYKYVWFIGVILPILLRGTFPAYAILYTVIFATYIIGDLIAIPFSYILARQEDYQTNQTEHHATHGQDAHQVCS
jgi:hypothetical protein